jgi:hypothetical protein
MRGDEMRKPLILLLMILISPTIVASGPVRPQEMGNLPTGSPLPSLTSGVSYTVRDEFTTNLGAGSVNGTAAEPGPGSRTVVDAAGQLTLNAGALTIAAGAGIPTLKYAAVSRANGRLAIFAQNTSAGRPLCGFFLAAGNSEATIELTASGRFYVNNATALTVGPAWSVPGAYSLAIALRSAGAYFLGKGGAFTNWTLLWNTDLGSTASVVPGYAGSSADAAHTSGYFRVPTSTWVPRPIAYDTFDRSNGAIGSTLAAGPESQVITAYAWSGDEGTVQVNTNKAVATAVAAGRAVATVTDSATTDILIGAKLVKTTTGAGVMSRYADATHYVYGWHDGTNAIMVQNPGTGDVNKVSAVTAYSASAEVRLIWEGTSCTLYYNNAKIGATQTLAGMTGTKHGIVFLDTDSTLDDFWVFPRGTGGEYNVLGHF